MPDPTPLKVAEAAKRLGISRQAVYQACDRGALEPVEYIDNGRAQLGVSERSVIAYAKARTSTKDGQVPKRYRYTPQ